MIKEGINEVHTFKQRTIINRFGVISKLFFIENLEITSFSYFKVFFIENLEITNFIKRFETNQLDYMQ